MEWRGCSAPKSGRRQRPFRRISRASSRDPCSGTNGHRVKRGALLSFSNRSSTVSILVVLVTSVKTDSTVPKPGGEYLWTLWVQGFCMSFIIFACCSCPSRPVLASSCFFLSDNLPTTIHEYHSQYYKQPSVLWCRRVLGLCLERVQIVVGAASLSQGSSRLPAVRVVPTPRDSSTPSSCSSLVHSSDLQRDTRLDQPPTCLVFLEIPAYCYLNITRAVYRLAVFSPHRTRDTHLSVTKARSSPTPTPDSEQHVSRFSSSKSVSCPCPAAA